MNMHLRMGLSENTHIYAYKCMYKTKCTELFEIVEFVIFFNYKYRFKWYIIDCDIYTKKIMITI